MENRCSVCKTENIISKDDDYSICVNGHIQYDTVGMELTFEEHYSQKKILNNSKIKKNTIKKTNQTKRKRDVLRDRSTYLEVLEIQFILCYLLSNYNIEYKEYIENSNDGTNIALFINNIGCYNESYYRSMFKIYYGIDMNDKDMRDRNRHMKPARGNNTSRPRDKNQEDRNAIFERKREAHRKRLKVPNIDIDDEDKLRCLYRRYKYIHNPNYENYERTNPYNYLGNPYSLKQIHHKATEERPSESPQETISSKLPTKKLIKKDFMLEYTVKSIYKTFLSIFIKGINSKDVSYNYMKGNMKIGKILKKGENIDNIYKLRNGVFQIKTNLRNQLYHQKYYPINIENGLFILYLGLIRCNYNINLQLIYKMIQKRDLIYYDYLNIFPKNHCNLSPHNLYTIRRYSTLSYSCFQGRFENFCNFMGMNDFSKEWNFALKSKGGWSTRKFRGMTDDMADGVNTGVTGKEIADSVNPGVTGKEIADKTNDSISNTQQLPNTQPLSNTQPTNSEQQPKTRKDEIIKNRTKYTLAEIPSLHPSSFMLTQTQIDWNLNILIDTVYLGGLRNIIFAVFRKVKTPLFINGTPNGTDYISFMLGIIITISYDCSLSVKKRLFRELKPVWIYKAYERDMMFVVDKNRKNKDISSLINRSFRLKTSKIDKLIKSANKSANLPNSRSANKQNSRSVNNSTNRPNSSSTNRPNRKSTNKPNSKSTNKPNSKSNSKSSTSAKLTLNRNNKTREYSSIFSYSSFQTTKPKTNSNKTTRLEKIEKIIEEINTLKYIKVLKQKNDKYLQFYEEVNPLVDYVEKVLGVEMKNIYKGIQEAKQAILHSYSERKNHL
eukprot:GHVP01059995.1.p1 GENE.GHVP01059995.1~~GHVP01059995.1.p1  ORF type:complete len:835 (+),score=101.16 GHVP01059995.1:411-2915(+)